MVKPRTLVWLGLGFSMGVAAGLLLLASRRASTWNRMAESPHEDETDMEFGLGLGSGYEGASASASSPYEW